MQFKVGELAKRSGLTVRTLHHYDAIGLLRPSGRSESGYRLYGSADVARLHAIQALRHLGLSLRDIASMLANNGASLPAIVARQIRALDKEIAQATELRARLDLLQAKLAQGQQPQMEDWLDTLLLMATYSKYFDVQELKKILGNWHKVEAQVTPLFKGMHAAMKRGVPHDALEIQPLVARWMQLAMQWVEGEEELVWRWAQMYEHEPSVAGSKKDGLDQETARYIGRAVEARLAALRRYFDPEMLARMGRVELQELDDFNRDGKALQARRSAPTSKAVQALAQRLTNLIGQITGGDNHRLQQLQSAYDADPLVRAGWLLDQRVCNFLMQDHSAVQRRMV